jgi:small-conductance mechanosensitive channel
MRHILEYELVHMKNFTLSIGSVILSVCIILANVLLVKLMSGFIKRRFRRKGGEEGRHYAIVQLLKYILWTIAIIFALQALGLDLTLLIASSAALLVGLGLGMQIIFKDFMSGIILLVEGTIKVGDIVQIGEDVLKVKEISLRTSQVFTREDKVVIIPNHKFTEENVINWTHNTTPTRFTLDIGVDYDSDIYIVEKSLLNATEQHKDILQEDEYKPFVRFTDFGASALQFQLIFWSDNLFRIENTKSALRFEIFKIFSKNNITIPFSQIVIHQAKQQP